jgi:hypothetical protein
MFRHYDTELFAARINSRRILFLSQRPGFLATGANVLSFLKSIARCRFHGIGRCARCVVTVPSRQKMVVTAEISAASRTSSREPTVAWPLSSSLHFQTHTVVYQ